MKEAIRAPDVESFYRAFSLEQLVKIVRAGVQMLKKQDLLIDEFRSARAELKKELSEGFDRLRSDQVTTGREAKEDRGGPSANQGQAGHVLSPETEPRPRRSCTPARGHPSRRGEGLPSTPRIPAPAWLPDPPKPAGG